MEQSLSLSVSVLVDGDSISGKHAGEILTLASHYGDPTVVRVYTYAQRPSDWHGAFGYRMLHAGTGMNAAHILLALDARELALFDNNRCFVIASSDGEFTHLATRLREHGAKVIGVGKNKAPNTFWACCSDYVEIGSKPSVRLISKPTVLATALDLNIRAMNAAHSTKGSGMRIVELAPKMHSLHGVRISKLPERSWRAYLIARQTLYDLDPRGPEAKVRFRNEGFKQAT